MTRAIRWACTNSTAFCRKTKARFCFYEEWKPSRSSAGFGHNLRWKLDKVWCQILEKVRAVWGLCRGQFQVFIRVPDCPAESRTIFGTIRWGASGLASFYGHRATRSAGSRGSAPGRRLAPPGWPPTTLSFNLGVGGRQPGGHRARKKSPGLCKSTRRALPFLVLKFPRRAMLPRQVMAI